MLPSCRASTLWPAKPVLEWFGMEIAEHRLRMLLDTHTHRSGKDRVELGSDRLSLMPINVRSWQLGTARDQLVPATVSSVSNSTENLS